MKTYIDPDEEQKKKKKKKKKSKSKKNEYGLTENAKVIME